MQTPSLDLLHQLKSQLQTCFMVRSDTQPPPTLQAVFGLHGVGCRASLPACSQLSVILRLGSSSSICSSLCLLRLLQTRAGFCLGRLRDGKGPSALHLQCRERCWGVSVSWHAQFVPTRANLVHARCGRRGPAGRQQGVKGQNLVG